MSHGEGQLTLHSGNKGHIHSAAQSVKKLECLVSNSSTGVADENRPYLSRQKYDLCVTFLSVCLCAVPQDPSKLLCLNFSASNRLVVCPGFQAQNFSLK